MNCEKYLTFEEQANQIEKAIFQKKKDLEELEMALNNLKYRQSVIDKSGQDFIFLCNYYGVKIN
jgi:hypothetical protein